MNLSIKVAVGWLWAVMVLAPSAAAQEQVPEVLKLVPPNAAIAIVLPNLDKTNTTLDKFISDLKLPMPLPPGGPVKMLLAEIGLTEGIDMKGSIAVVMPQLPLGGEPELYVALPIADEAKLMAKFASLEDVEGAEGVQTGKVEGDPTPLFIRKSGKHLLVSPTKTLITSFKAAADGKHVMETAGDLGRAQMASGLGYLWFNMKVVGPQLAPLARMGMAQATKQAIAEIEAAPADEGMDVDAIGGTDTVEAAMKMVGDLVNNFLTQTDSLVASIDLDKTGLRMNGSVQFTPGSMMAGLFPGGGSRALTLDAMPQGNYMVAMAYDAKALPFKAIADAVKADLLPLFDDADPRVRTAAEGYFESIVAAADANLVQGAWYESKGKRMEEIYNWGAVFDVDNGAATMARYRSSQQKMTSGIKDLLDFVNQAGGVPEGMATRHEITFTPNAETIDGVSVDRMRMKMQSPEQMQQMMPAMTYSGIPIDTLYGVRGNQIFTTQSKDSALFKKLLAVSGGGANLGTDASIIEARKALPGHRVGEGYLNVGGMVQMGVDMFTRMMTDMQAAMGGGGPQMPALPAVPAMPPVALAVTSKSGGVGYSVAVPRKTIVAVKDFGMNVAAMAMQMQGGGPGGPGMPPADSEDGWEEAQPADAPDEGAAGNDDVYQPVPSDDRGTGAAQPAGDAAVTALDDDSFAGTIGNAKPTLVVFTASWSSDSKRQAIAHRDLSRTLGQTVTFATVDIDAAPDATDGQGIVGVPTTILYKSGKKLETVTGVQDAAALKKLVEKHVN